MAKNHSLPHLQTRHIKNLKTCLGIFTKPQMICKIFSMYLDMALQYLMLYQFTCDVTTYLCRFGKKSTIQDFISSLLVDMTQEIKYENIMCIYMSFHCIPFVQCISNYILTRVKSCKIIILSITLIPNWPLWFPKYLKGSQGF